MQYHQVKRILEVNFIIIVFGLIEGALKRSNIVADAFPSRPGSCRTGNPMGSSHLEEDMFGSLEYAGLKVIYQNTTELVSRNNLLSLNTFTYHEFDLRVSNWDYFTSFRGVLLRLSSKVPDDIDASNVLTKSYPETQLSKLPSRGERDGLDSSCDYNVSALGHNNRKKKKKVTFEMYFDNPGTYLLEVTAVFQNNGRRKDGYFKADFVLDVV